MSNAASVIGWDIGGAHVKAAAVNADGELTRVVQVPCTLWKGLEHLDRAVNEARQILHAAPRHALTMTGEMVDLFPNRAAGVKAICERMQQLLVAPLRWYAGPRGFVMSAEAVASPWSVAAANWYASARWAARSKPDALLVDVGSTTTDLIPVRGGTICAEGADDASRLVSDELIYTGLLRTPLMAITDRVLFRGQSSGVMAEYFATMADVYRVLGQIDEAYDQHDAADNGPKTIEGSMRRIARMIGRDLSDATSDEWTALAREFARKQRSRIAAGMRHVIVSTTLTAPVVVGAGAGAAIVRDLARDMTLAYCDFSELVPLASQDDALARGARVCAPSVAVALLAAHDRVRVA